MRWMVIVDIVDGNDGGRNVGGDGGCDALIEEGLGEAVGISLDDAGDGQGDDRRGGCGVYLFREPG